jgi:hypothetical protein
MPGHRALQGHFAVGIALLGAEVMPLQVRERLQHDEPHPDKERAGAV